MDAEIAMLLAGVYDGELLRAITPKAAELTTPLTAYGPRVRHQLPLIVQELQDDPQSRRAVVYVGSGKDLARIGKDTANEMPCTMTWQFLVRSELHMIVNMRSWDACWGLAYDVPCFVAVQMAVAHALGVPLGPYHHHAGSFHLYERHWDVQARPTDASLHLDYLHTDIEGTRLLALTLIESMKTMEKALV
jgi:thymidylate synthase